MTRSDNNLPIHDPQELIDELIRGYRKSNVLFAAYETGILSKLAEKKVSGIFLPGQ